MYGINGTNDSVQSSHMPNSHQVTIDKKGDKPSIPVLFIIIRLSPLNL